MPNWNSNYIEIETKVNPKKFMIKNREWKFSLCFEKILPFWEWDYDKAVNWWGTKWDIAEMDENHRTGESEWYCDIEKKQKNYIITCYYETAWAPPTWFLDALYSFLIRRDKNSTLRNSYFEPGCGVLGIYENGSDFDLCYWDTVGYSWRLEAYITDDKHRMEVLKEFNECVYTKQEAFEELEKIKETLNEEEYEEEFTTINDVYE